MPTISSISPLVYAEGSSGGLVDPNITITGATAYTEGYIEFATSVSATGDQFTLTSAVDGDVVGAISVVGQDVFLGNGTGRDRIGSIDQTFNGQDGQPLRILFASPLPNAGFEEGEANWSVKDELYGDSGSELNLDNISIQLANDLQYTGGTGTTNIQSSASVGYDGSVADGEGIDGTRALFLRSDGDIVFGDQAPGGSGFQQNGYGSIHGPYATSSVISVQTGDSLSLDFRAVGDGDDYEVFGFLRRVDANGDFISNNVGDTANNIQLFAQRGDDTGGFVTITEDGLPGGDYRFEFVGGTYDGSGGLYVGSNLYVDNIRLISATTVNDSVAQTIARQVAYTNTGDDAPPSRTITVTAVDAAGVSGSSTGQLDFTPENDSPTLANVTLASIAEDEAPVGVTISAAFTSAFGDPDNAHSPTDSMAGILITGNAATAAQGAWQYSTNGTDWREVGAVSATAGLLLNASTLLRFLPALDWNGTPGALQATSVDSTYTGTFTQDTTRVTFDATSDDATISPVGQTSASVSIAVTAVNDAPVAVDIQGTGVENETINGQLVRTDADGDAVTYTLVQGAQDANGNTVAGLTFNPDGSYSFQGPANFNGAVTFTYQASDGTVASAPATVTLAVAAVADAPVAPVLADQAGIEDQGVAFQVPAFADMDGDVLTYGATLADGTALPSWLVFNPATRSFSGQPPADFNGTLALTVSASDGQATASSTFALTMAAVADAPVAGADILGGSGQARIYDGAQARIDVEALLANDIDPDSSLDDAVGFAGIVAGPARGTLDVVVEDGHTYLAYTYDGPEVMVGASALDAFTYRIVDASGAMTTATASLAVTGLPDRDIDGTSRADTIQGGVQFHDTVYAGAGADLVRGNAGHDRLWGEAGDDRLWGGEGRDFVVGGTGRDWLLGEADADTLFGGTARDVLSGGAGNDSLHGESGEDVLWGGQGADRVWGNNGADQLYGGNSNDRLWGNSGADQINGDSGADWLWGNNDADQLYGGEGADRLHGGEGADILTGGSGRDDLFGGQDASRDTFVFASLSDSHASGSDTVHDFHTGEDIIDLRGIDARVASADTNNVFAVSNAGPADYSVWWSQQGSDMVLSADVTGDQVADFRLRLADLNQFSTNDLLL